MSNRGVFGLLLEPLLASGRSSEKLSLPSLQSKMKCDPEGYESELVLVYSQFNSSLELFQQQAALNFSSISGIGSDPSVAKDLGDRAMFLAHVTPFYPKHLADFPKKLADLLRVAARSLPSGLRCHLAQALILLLNRKIVDIGETLSLFMELQNLGDRTLRKLAFDHVIHSIKRMNQKHKNEAKNRRFRISCLQCYSKRMKQGLRGHSQLYVSFIVEKCGLMIEQQMLFVLLAFIHHQGS